MLKLYNTLTKKKEFFLFKKIYKIYVCGITVYDNCHIGHSRVFLFFDSFIRYLNFLGSNVVYVRNITDVDDKIINKAISFKKSIKYISEKYTKNMHIINNKLSIIEPSFEPKATNFINQMLVLINKLIDKKYAYRSKNNDFCFNIKEYKFYGKLSGVNLNFSVDSNKIKKEDFVLWKSLGFKEKFKWFSDLGFGRPGWHTECSAMSMYYFKDFIDIHGGGRDLIFPHHENEIAQCESLIGCNFVNTWIHVAHLKILNKKMSKSKKNYILASSLLENFNEEVIRLFFLMTHYKKQLCFSFESLNKTKKIFEKFYKIIILLKSDNCDLSLGFKKKFLDALNDNFNTPKAIFVLFDILKEINLENNFYSKNSQNLIYTIKYLGNIIGIFKNVSIKFSSFYIENLILTRDIARKNKNWDLADKIRIKLEKKNIRIEDRKNFTDYFEIS